MKSSSHILYQICHETKSANKPADVAIQYVIDLLHGGLGVFLQPAVQLHHHARGAVPALASSSCCQLGLNRYSTSDSCLEATLVPGEQYLWLSTAAARLA